MERDITELRRVLSLVAIPEDVTNWFVENQYFESLRTLSALRPADVPSLREAYASDGGGEWKYLYSAKLTLIIRWLNEYYEYYNCAPEEGYIDLDKLSMSPGYQDAGSPQYPMTPGGQTPVRGGPRRTSAMTSDTHFSQGRRNVKISITEFPKLSGKARDWIHFERKLLSVASSQG